MSGPDNGLPPIPPIGVEVATDLEYRRSGIRARARWDGPPRDEEADGSVHSSFGRRSGRGVLPSRPRQRPESTGVSSAWSTSPLSATVGCGAPDPTSTVDGYKIGLRLRVLPSLGHLPISQITAGMIDRTIDDWETRCSASTIQNTIAPLVRVLSMKQSAAMSSRATPPASVRVAA